MGILSIIQRDSTGVGKHKNSRRAKTANRGQILEARFSEGSDVLDYARKSNADLLMNKHERNVRGLKSSGFASLEYAATYITRDINKAKRTSISKKKQNELNALRRMKERREILRLRHKPKKPVNDLKRLQQIAVAQEVAAGKRAVKGQSEMVKRTNAQAVRNRQAGRKTRVWIPQVTKEWELGPAHRFTPASPEYAEGGKGHYAYVDVVDQPRTYAINAQLIADARKYHARNKIAMPNTTSRERRLVARQEGAQALNVRNNVLPALLRAMGL